MKINQIVPTSFADYVKKISTLRKENETLWFRGMSKTSYHLIPSLYRGKETKPKEEFSSLERSLIERFQERSLPYQNVRFEKSWEWIFFMQHYGIPTRLLDWSENPFVALFFSIIKCEKIKNGTYKDDAVVWVLNPEKWNKAVLEFQGFSGGILSINDQQLKPFNPPADFTAIPDYPLAINGAYNSTRIAAQRGTFVIFGMPNTTMDKYYENKIKKRCLDKVIIEKDKIDKIKDEIVKSGITESVVFPDLDGLARELKRQFGYGA